MKSKTTPRIAIVGGGLGGAAAGALLKMAGFEARIYEQAPCFSPVGAGIHLSPNVMQVLHHIGIARNLAQNGCRPDAFVSRAWDSGDILFSLPLGDQAQSRYAAPYLTVRRGDFHAALMSALEPGAIEFGKRLADIDSRGSAIRLIFEDGSCAEADAVIGADGLNSRIREILHGAERPDFSGQVAYRSTFPASLLDAVRLEDLTKWWAPDRFVIAYFLTHARDVFYFVAGFPEAEWPHESSWVQGERAELLAAFDGFHPDVQRILRSGTDISKWALFERAPIPVWGNGRIVLLGDACHPMRPHMAQGAAMAIEDAAMMVRCLALHDPPDFERAFTLYAQNRMSRTSQVQHISSENTWLREETDPGWVFSYNALNEKIVLS